ncbi:MAG: hypothetical protein V8T86_02275 [Victivallis sp.]
MARLAKEFRSSWRSGRPPAASDRVSAILDLCDITVLSGDDSLTLPMMSVGAKGIVGASLRT